MELRAPFIIIFIPHESECRKGQRKRWERMHVSCLLGTIPRNCHISLACLSLNLVMWSHLAVREAGKCLCCEWLYSPLKIDINNWGELILKNNYQCQLCHWSELLVLPNPCSTSHLSISWTPWPVYLTLPPVTWNCLPSFGHLCSFIIMPVELVYPKSSILHWIHLNFSCPHYQWAQIGQHLPQ